MGSTTFGLPTSGNNAPLPVPGNTNPTGTNSGVGFNGASFPSYPVFGAPPSSPVSPSANSGVFGGTSMQGLSSGIWPTGPAGDQLYKQLSQAYGKGTAGILAQILSNGLFNPQVASSFLNAMQPGVNRGEASILDAFGAEGSRFGSAAALGQGDYLSQVNLNEQQTLAGLFENAQSQELGVLSGILPTLHAEQANKGSWLDDLVGGLEIAGGIAAAPFTGGLSLMAVPGGISELNKGIGGGGGGNVGPSPSFGIPMGQGWNNTGTFGQGAPIYTGAQSSPFSGSMSDWEQMVLQSSAGSDLGASAPTDSGFVPFFGG